MGWSCLKTIKDRCRAIGSSLWVVVLLDLPRCSSLNPWFYVIIIHDDDVDDIWCRRRRRKKNRKPFFRCCQHLRFDYLVLHITSRWWCEYDGSILSFHPQATFICSSSSSQPAPKVCMYISFFLVSTISSHFQVHIVHRRKPQWWWGKSPSNLLCWLKLGVQHPPH